MLVSQVVALSAHKAVPSSPSLPANILNSAPNVLIFSTQGQTCVYVRMEPLGGGHSVFPFSGHIEAFCTVSLHLGYSS